MLDFFRRRRGVPAVAIGSALFVCLRGAIFGSPTRLNKFAVAENQLEVPKY